MSLTIQCLVSPPGRSRRDEGIVVVRLAYDAAAQESALQTIAALERRVLEFGCGPVALTEYGDVDPSEVNGKKVGDCRTILAPDFESFSRVLSRTPAQLRELARGAKPFDPSQFYHGEWTLFALVETSVTGERVCSERWPDDQKTQFCIVFAAYPKAQVHAAALTAVLAILENQGYTVVPEERPSLPRDILSAVDDDTL